MKTYTMQIVTSVPIRAASKSAAKRKAQDIAADVYMWLQEKVLIETESQLKEEERRERGEYDTDDRPLGQVAALRAKAVGGAT